MSEEPRRAVPSLAEVELETLEEGREWTRRRLERKLQRLADSQGAISPPQSPPIAQGEESRDDDHEYGG